MLKHKHFDANTVGKDYIVGDLHGCYSELITALEQIGFNFVKDRLFSVGDLVDRGPQSKECAELIYEPWFHAIQGNHEALMYGAIINLCMEDHLIWLRNGGLWNQSEEKWWVHDMAADLKQLPLVISVGEGKDRFNIVHAELIKDSTHRGVHGATEFITDADLDTWNITANTEYDMIWGRNIYYSQCDNLERLLPCNPLRKHQSLFHKDLSPTYVGHTIVNKPIQIFGQIFIDTGCSLMHRRESYNLTIACPVDKVYHMYNSAKNNVTVLPHSKIDKYL